MAPKLSTFQDPFTGTAINTGLWNNITAGTASLDATNDLVTLQQPTVSGTSNTFGTTLTYDATSSSLFAQVGVSPNGNGNTKTILKLQLDANNAVSMRVESGALKLTLLSAGTTVNTTLAAAYDPNAHAWWRLRESSGVFYADASADGWTWTQLGSTSYSWSATALQVLFQTAAGGTEAAGNVAWIAHVNTLLGGAYNLNFPRTEEAWGPHWACNGGDSPLDRFVDVSTRTRQQTSVNRGRQYELDQVRAGEYGLTLANTDGALDPTNTSGPFYGRIMPYQPYRKRCQWPPSRNLLTQVQATGGDLGGLSLGAISQLNSGPSIFSQVDSTGGQFVSSTSAWLGSTVMQYAVATSATAGQFVCYTPQVAVLPGGTYTVTAQVRNITASSSVPVAAQIQWRDTSQNTISTTTGTASTLTGSATAGWTTVTVSGTAPANAAMMYVGPAVTAAPTANCSVQVDGWQLEPGGAASAWQCPGTWYPVYAGFVERWPSTWDMGGTYGLVQPTAVDATALLSQVILRDPLAQEILSRSPRFLYTLGDPSGSTSAADSTGNYPAITVQSAKGGAGSLTFGNQITAASSTGTFTGGSGTVVTVANPNPGTNIIGAASYLDLDLAGIKGPANPSVAWTRMLAFRYTAGTPSAAAYMWDALDSQRPSMAAQLNWQLNSSGQFTIVMGSGGGIAFTPAATNVADSNWHLAIASYSHANAQLIINLDGASYFYGSFNPSLEPVGLVSDSLGNWVDPTTGRGAAFNWQGDLAYCAEFSSALSSSDMAAIYTAWKSSCAGESTDARYARILRYAGYIGVSSIQAGVTTSMGPAALDGQDALSALQAVVDTENGEHYADRAGTMTFKSRLARYNSLTPVYVFGENTAAGEFPYEDCQFDYDPTHLSNLVQITQASSGQIFTSQDTTSQTDYFPRTLQRTVNASSTLECQAAAQYLCSRYKQPASRVSALVLHPAANPLLWPVCLSLELGMRVRVNRRPPGAPPITNDCFVENVQISMTDQGDAVWTLQCSPADLTPYGLVASLHSTLQSQANSGSNTIVLGALTGSASNPAAAVLCAGTVLTVGYGTSVAENMTVQSVGSTSPGYTTVTVTLTGNLANTHASGAVVCQPLPSGYVLASQVAAGFPASMDSAATVSATGPRVGY